MGKDLLTRRRLLQATAGGAVALTAGPSFAWSSTRGAGHLRRDSYEGRIGERFTVQVPGEGGVSLRLNEVADYGHGAVARRLKGRQDAFVLVFGGPRTPRLEAAIHRLAHPSLGRFPLFLSPTGPTGRRQEYCAVVNRIRDTRVLEAPRRV